MSLSATLSSSSSSSSLLLGTHSLLSSPSSVYRVESVGSVRVNEDAHTHATATPPNTHTLRDTHMVLSPLLSHREPHTRTRTHTHMMIRVMAYTHITVNAPRHRCHPRSFDHRRIPLHHRRLLHHLHYSHRCWREGRGSCTCCTRLTETRTFPLMWRLSSCLRS